MLPKEKAKKEKKKFKIYPIGCFHVDIAEVQAEEDRLYLFSAIDRTSKFAYAELHDEATRATTKVFLEHLITAEPYIIHTILTNNGIQFTNRKRDIMAFITSFDRVCHSHRIEHD